jgi:hypothetical protein
MTGSPIGARRGKMSPRSHAGAKHPWPNPFACRSYGRYGAEHYTSLIIINPRKAKTSPDSQIGYTDVEFDINIWDGGAVGEPSTEREPGAVAKAVVDSLRGRGEVDQQRK